MTTRASCRTARRRDGNADEQPIWLTDRGENPNGATMLVLVDGATTRRPCRFGRLLDLFDGNDDDRGRGRPRALEGQGRRPRATYWQQTDAGWEQKA